MSLPRFLYLPAAVGFALLLLPIVGLISRVRWNTLGDDLFSSASMTALGLSVSTAACATLVCMIVGLPMALLVGRAGRRMAAVMRTLVLIPLVLPPMVGGLALLSLLGRSGLIGEPIFAWSGFSLPYTTGAVVVAQAFVALPFFVITVEGALRTSGVSHEQIASTLGAGRWRVLTRITLPLVMPGLVAGTVLAFARALGEFGATALFAGNAPGVTRTMPLAIYTAFNGVGVTQDSAVALSLLLLVSAAVIVCGLRSWREDAVR
ncbi:molybdate ABC transporter permease subunit [Gordonia sp. HY002]|uniref:molybdate ABC transporter permease subunit n=1 Tax=Gordonia zhenghanii TaxID=2911516 RepID=UPI001EF036C4|nr:molybdate ABC transporter permease subunit [Gordonia zhenghanii]MCF8571768.1 molybdate ABC transporter permease subunit [Gordonia zhenghanii]MCF8604907.1 molybdate ABC transporter permease subunit [Gordonia zhenghanii]